MRKLLSSITWGDKFRVFAFFVIIIFTFSLASFKSGGNRPLRFFSQLEGCITKVEKDARFNPSRHGANSSSKCVAIFIDSFHSRIINENQEYSHLLKQGMDIKLWVYKTGYDYNFVQVSNSGELIIRNNEKKGRIVFTLLMASSVFLLIVLYVFLFRRK
jgi:hypothetical protein